MSGTIPGKNTSLKYISMDLGDPNIKGVMNKEKYNMFGTIPGKNMSLKHISMELGDKNID